MDKKDREKRRSMIENLKTLRANLLRQSNGQQRNIPDNVVSLPGGQSTNPSFQQVSPNNGTNFVRRMKAPHPGIPVATDNDRNELPRAGFASGLILAGITFVTELLFLAISYFMFK